MENDNPVIAEIEKFNKELPVEVERLNHEYNKYFSGAEKKPPLQLRDQLEKKAARLQAIIRQCTVQQVSFRAQATLAKVNTYRTMWDKRLLDRENAKKKS